jgi:CBS domain-containing protein
MISTEVLMKRPTVSDVMTRDVVTVSPEIGFREIADLLVQRTISAVPVVDEHGVVLGVVSEADLLPKLEYADRLPTHALALRRTRIIQAKAAGGRAIDLMTAPAVTIEPSVSVTQAARRLESARVKRLPVVDRTGRLVGIVSRRDLVRMYVRTDVQLLRTVLEILDAMWIEAGTVEVTCNAGVVHLTGQVDRSSEAQILTSVIRATPGVVNIRPHLTFRHDDTDRRRQPIVI